MLFSILQAFHVVVAIRDLFQTVLNFKQEEIGITKENNNECPKTVETESKTKVNLFYFCCTYIYIYCNALFLSFSRVIIFYILIQDNESKGSSNKLSTPVFYKIKEILYF